MNKTPPKRNKVGRPPLPKSRLRVDRFNIFLSRAESRKATKAALDAGFQDVPKWARDLILKEIKEQGG